MPVRSLSSSLAVVLTALVAGAALLAPPLDAQETGRAFTTQDALDVRTVRVADVTPDARWIAATVSTRRDRSNVDHFRFGDPTYIAPSLGELLVVDAGSGATRSLFPAPEQLRGAAWSPDGKRLAFFRLQGSAFRLYMHDAAANRTAPVALKTTKALSAESPLVWSPDGTKVLVALRPDGWAERARTAFVQLTEGPIVVQTSKDDFLDWDRVRGMADEQLPALVTVANGTVTELPVQASLADPHFSEDGSYLVYAVADRRRTAYERAKGTWYGLFRHTLGGSAVDTLIAPREQRLTGQWNEQATRYAYAEKGNVFVRGLGGDSAMNVTATYRTPVSATDTSKRSYAWSAGAPTARRCCSRRRRATTCSTSPRATCVPCWSCRGRRRRVRASRCRGGAPTAGASSWAPPRATDGRAGSCGSTWPRGAWRSW